MQLQRDILVVDDDQPIVDLIAELLVEEGYSVRTGITTDDARLLIAERHPDLLLCDLHLPDKNGDVLARELKNDGLIDIPVMLMTADSLAARTLSMDNIVCCLLKPFDINDLIDCVAKYIRRGEAHVAYTP